MRYWHIGRIDTLAHPIAATVVTTVRSREAVAYSWVVSNTGGRRAAFDIGAIYGYTVWPTAGSGDVATPRCLDAAGCTDDIEMREDILIEVPVRLDYFIATQDADVDIRLSAESRKHWRVKELTGPASVTGSLRLVLPEDGTVTTVEAGSIAVQRLQHAEAPGGRYGSLSLATKPMRYSSSVPTAVGFADVTGGVSWVNDRHRLDTTHDYVVGYADKPTTWIVNGDLISAGARTGPVLAVYDLPSPAALAAYMRRR
jgi:hypothetical protein